MSSVTTFPTLASVLAQPGHEALGAGSGSSAHEELGKLQQEFEEAWFEAGGGTLRSPSLGGTSTTHYLGAMLDEIQERRSALCMKPYSPPMRNPIEETSSTPPPPPPSVSAPSLLTSLPPPPPLVRVNAFGPAIGLSPLSPFSVFNPESEDNIMEQLSVLRSRLQIKQDFLYRGLQSEEELGRARQESMDLDIKINAIEDVLRAFNVTFRNR